MILNKFSQEVITLPTILQVKFFLFKNFKIPTIRFLLKTYNLTSFRRHDSLTKLN